MAIDTIYEMFRKLVTEFAEIPEEDLRYIIVEEDKCFSKSIDEDLRNRILTFWVAHIVDTCNKKNGASSGVTSITEGELSMSYSTMPNPKDSLECSNYGRLCKMLISQCSITPLI
jgi:hypothetical protein